MRIHLSSDLHLELTDGVTPPLNDQADVIVLAGDIAVGDQVLSYVEQLTRQHRQAEILFVAGNHEYYGADYDQRQAAYQRAFADFERAHFLEREAVTVDGVRFLGCTLWSGFDSLPDTDSAEAMREAGSIIPDFALIRRGGALFQPQDALKEYRASRKWLREQLDAGDAARSVIITHFPPSLNVSHGTIPVNVLSAYFQADCDELIHRYQPALWLYGHNHWSDDVNMGSTRLVSNQGGYPNEGVVYNPQLLIDLGNKAKR
jgi:Icc-related predicted phosphoesterase